MTITEIAPRCYEASENGIKLLFGYCDEGCRWSVEPDYRTYELRGRHSTSPEAVLPLPRVEPFDPAAATASLWAWLDRCHAYERGGQAS